MRYLLNLVTGNHGKLNKVENSLLYKILHNRDDVFGKSSRNPTLDIIIKDHSEKPTSVLYRGLTQEELRKIEAMMKGGSINIGRYLAFTEVRSHAELASAKAKTKTMLEIFPTSSKSGKALNYRKTLVEQIKSGRLDGMVGASGKAKTRSLEYLEDEREWFFPFDFKFEVFKTYMRGPQRIITIKPI